MLKLDSDIDIGLFFKWWGQELSFLLPQKFREALKGKGLLVVEVFTEMAKVSHVTDEQEVLLGEFAFNALAKDELQGIIENNAHYSDLEIVLRVPEPFSVKQDIFLPVAAESNLYEVVGYELDRYTPFTKEQVYFDVIKLERVNNKTLIHLVLVLVKKSSLELMYEHCLTLGLKPAFADSAAQPVMPGEAANQYNLLPKELCLKVNKMPLFIMFGALLVTLVLFAVLLIVPLNTGKHGVERLKQHAHQVEKIALETEDSKKSIDSLYQSTQKLIDKKNSSPSMVDVMNVVSHELDDNTWVSQWRYTNNTLQLTGQSASASNLIASLEKMAMFQNVKFISPVTKDNRTGLERFKISIDVIKEQRDATAE